jgi:hypothetical protein
VLAEKHAAALRKSQQGKHPYGRHTLVEGPAARYEFWPSMAKQTPLLLRPGHSRRQQQLHHLQ